MDKGPEVEELAFPDGIPLEKKKKAITKSTIQTSAPHEFDVGDSVDFVDIKSKPKRKYTRRKTTVSRKSKTKKKANNKNEIYVTRDEYNSLVELVHRIFETEGNILADLVMIRKELYKNRGFIRSFIDWVKGK